MNNGDFKNSRRHVVCYPSTLKEDSVQIKIKVLKKFYPISSKVSNGKVKKLVCFSLWGKRKIYHKGAFTNASLVPKIYGKDWKVRVYVASDIPKSVISNLLRRNAEVFVMNTNSTEAGSIGAFWRFLPLSETNTILLTRDLDSRPTYRESLAVKEWLRSKMKFHRIYDTNMDEFNVIDKKMFKGKPCIVPFFAGLFGAISKSKPVVPNILSKINKYKYKFSYGGEEKFLSDIILPIAKLKGIYTSIMHAHNIRQGSLFLKETNKHMVSKMKHIPVTKQGMTKYQVHAEYHPSSNSVPITFRNFMKTFQGNTILLPTSR